MRGQAAIESLFLLLVIITATIFVLGLYSQTHDSTVGISIVRTEIHVLASSMDEMVLVKNVSLNKTISGDTIFVIVTDPNTLSEVDFGSENLNGISEKITASTRLTNISYQIN